MSGGWNNGFIVGMRQVFEVFSREASLFRALSPLLPLTHVVRALRAAMFGSYGGEWGGCILPAIPWAAVSLGLSFLSRKRFLYVPDAAYGPALDLSFGRRAR